QLINRTDPSGGGSGSAQASLGTAAGRAAASLTLSEKDALRSQMQRCWSPPIGLAGGESLVVTVQIRLSPDGAVVNIEDVGGGAGQLYASAADAARRAVLQCQPYRLPVAKYDAWKDVQVNFDPRDLF
ncbi:MAG: cell envelope integrity protein TolA, partial [Pseudomonadota bacterium]